MNFYSPQQALFRISLMLAFLWPAPLWSQRSESKTSLATASKKFLTLHGDFEITEAPPELPELFSKHIIFDGKSGNAIFPSNDPDDPLGSGSFSKPKANSIVKKIFGSLHKGRFAIESGGSALNQRFLDVLGPAGDFEVLFPPGSQFGEFIGTLKPDGGTVDQLTFRAKLFQDPILTEVILRPKLVIRVKATGVPKAGNTMTFKIDVLNRGPHIMPPDGAFLRVLLTSPVSGVGLSKFKRVKSNCTEGTIEDDESFTLVDCPLDYLGPPDKTTFGSVTAKVKIPDELAGQKLNLRVFTLGSTVSPDTSGKNLFFNIKGSKPPPDDDDDDDGGLSEFVGLFEFTTTRNGAVFSRIRVNCRLDAGVVNCDIEDLQGTVSSYKLGDRVLKNLRFVTATTLRGDLLGAVDLQYRDSEFIIFPRFPAKGLLCIDYPDLRDYAFKRP